MSFHQPFFLFAFLPLCLLLFSLPGTARGRFAVISLLSAVYYIFADLSGFVLLFGICAANVFALEGLKRLGDTSARKVFVAFTVLLNLLPLFVVKYSDPSLVSSQHGSLAVNELVIPLGISFYTFQIVFLYVSGDYLQKSVNRYSFIPFVVFFPQLVLGPIQRFRELVPQLAHPRICVEWQILGLLTIGLALFKKRVLAQSLLPAIQSYDSVFSSGVAVSSYDAWCYMLANAAYIYLDFSAYADLAVGIGLLMGIKLLDGFNSPFQAPSIGDFWRRWNITLMRFFREAIYRPLVNKAGSTAQVKALGVLLVMVSCGIWHGPGIHFVLWGALVAGLIILERIGKELGISISSRLARLAWVVMGFVVPLVVFLNPDMTRAFAILLPMFSLTEFHLLPTNVVERLQFLPYVEYFVSDFGTHSIINSFQFAWLLFIWCVLLFSPPMWKIRIAISNRVFNRTKSAFSPPAIFLWLCSLILIVGSSMVKVGSSGFFYFQF